MDVQDQQNALAQAQLSEYQRARKEEEDYRVLASQPGFNPLSAQSLTQAYQISPTLGMKVLAAQEQAKLHAAAAANQAGEQNIRRQRFQAELPGLVAGAEKTELEKTNTQLGLARQLAMQVVQTGQGYDELRKAVQGTPWASMLGKTMDPRVVRGIATEAATIQEYLKPHIQTTKEGDIVSVQPGIGGAPTTLRPAIVTPEGEAGVEAPVQETFKGRMIPPEEGLPAERKPMTQRQYKELPAREQSTQIFKDLLNNFERLNERGDMPAEGQSFTQRARNVLAGTPAGQELSRFTNPKAQAIRDVIDKQIDQYIQTKRATGAVSAQEANTIDELVRLKSMLGSPKFDIDAVRQIIANADKYSGTGALSTRYEPTEKERQGVIDARKLQGGARRPLSSFYEK